MSRPERREVNEYIILHAQNSGKIFMERVIASNKDKAMDISRMKDDNCMLALDLEEYERMRSCLLRINMCEVL